VKFHNYELKHLYEFLLSLELMGKQNRMRTRFCKLIQQRIEEVHEERDKLILQFSEKDEEGNPKTERVNNDQVKYVLNDVPAFTNELDLLLSEEFVLDETEANKDLLLTVANLVLNLDISFSGQEAMKYDRYCEVFEQLAYSNENNSFNSI